MARAITRSIEADVLTEIVIVEYDNRTLTFDVAVLGADLVDNTRRFLNMRVAKTD